MREVRDRKSNRGPTEPRTERYERFLNTRSADEQAKPSPINGSQLTAFLNR